MIEDQRTFQLILEPSRILYVAIVILLANKEGYRYFFYLSHVHSWRYLLSIPFQILFLSIVIFLKLSSLEQLTHMY